MARQSREAKATTKETITREAARLFRERGIDGTSVADVMKAADKTHGGFYRHFTSKDDLLEAALAAAFADIRQAMAANMPTDPVVSALATFADFYLGADHVGSRGTGCPVAALAGDVSRGADGTRAMFGSETMQMVDIIANMLDGPPGERQVRALQAFSIAAGALMIARASDDETAAQFLGAARVAFDGFQEHSSAQALCPQGDR